MDSGSDLLANGGSGSGDTEFILDSDASDHVQHLCALDTVVQSIWAAVPTVEGNVASESDPSSVEMIIPLETPTTERLAARQAQKDQLSWNAQKLARRLQKTAAAERAAKRKVIRDGDGRDKASRLKSRKEMKIGNSITSSYIYISLLFHLWLLLEMSSLY
jgi:hypothetical protein